MEGLGLAPNAKSKVVILANGGLGLSRNQSSGSSPTTISSGELADAFGF